MRVVASTVDGAASAQLELAADSTVANLKELCAGEFRFPAIFQKLLVGLSSPQDSDTLASLCPPGIEELRVTFTLALGCMEDDDDYVRWDAHEALAALVAQKEPSAESTERAISAVCVSLKDPEMTTRRLAYRLLNDIGTATDARVLPAACAGLEDKDPQVTCQALEVMGKFAQAGEGKAAEALLECLKNAPMKHGEDVTFAAVRTLGILAAKGETKCVEALCVQLQDGNGYLRLLALDVLSVSVEKGDKVACAAVGERLSDRSGSLRQKAMEVYSKLVNHGDEAAIAEIASHVQDESKRMRCSTLIALKAIAPKGNKTAVSAACSCVADEEVDVRCVALEILADIAEKGDGEAIAAARSRLEPKDEDSNVVEAAEDAVKALEG